MKKPAEKKIRATIHEAAFSMTLEELALSERIYDLLCSSGYETVGDLMFQHRCMHRINRLRDAGVSIVLVSHDLSAITRFCDRCLLLDQTTAH
jgi:ABC-type hemin transport system ATPase subunit